MYSIAHIVEIFKIFSQFVATLSNNPFRIRDLNKIRTFSAGSSISHIVAITSNIIGFESTLYIGCMTFYW